MLAMWGGRGLVVSVMLSCVCGMCVCAEFNVFQHILVDCLWRKVYMYVCVCVSFKFGT